MLQSNPQGLLTFTQPAQHYANLYASPSLKPAFEIQPAQHYARLFMSNPEGSFWHHDA
jgi:hypothetical protein